MRTARRHTTDATGPYTQSSVRVVGQWQKNRILGETERRHSRFQLYLYSHQTNRSSRSESPISRSSASIADPATQLLSYYQQRRAPTPTHASPDTTTLSIQPIPPTTMLRTPHITHLAPRPTRHTQHDLPPSREATALTQP
jgi:hypothetical protein